MAVNLTDFTDNVNNIQALSDKPNETDGLTSGELKAKFDKAGADIKRYINGTHIPELEEVLNNVYSDLSEAETSFLQQLQNIINGLGLGQDTYDSTKSYQVGDRVIHLFAVWECTTDTTGDWNENNWEKIPLIVER